MRKIFILILAALMLCLSGCNAVISDNSASAEEVSRSSVTSSTSTAYGFTFDSDDFDYTLSDPVYVTLSNENYYINSGGTYVFTGESSSSIIVDAGKDSKVRLVLDNVNISTEDFAAIYVVSAKKTTVTLNEGSVNYLKDNGSYTQIDENNVDAIIFSKDDLVLNGTGTLNIETANHGIVSKDDLTFIDGSYNITASGQGIRGKDSVLINDGSYSIISGKDSIKSDNEEDEYRGYVYIAGGDFHIESMGDGIYGYNLIRIDDGTFSIETSSSSENSSYKGIKTDGDIQIYGGNFSIDTYDDSIHSNGSIEINGGTFTLSTEDDGIHADNELTVNDGNIIISKSYEGLEGTVITINGGDINITSEDDGINAASGGAGNSWDMDHGGRKEDFTGNMPQVNTPDTPVNSDGETYTPLSYTSPAFNGANTDSSIKLIINGGNIYVNATGDGIDSNGSIEINGGTVYVNGPNSNGDSSFDYDGEGIINGGEVLMLGSSGMASGFSSSSSQVNLLYCLSTSYGAGSTVRIIDSSGNTILEMTSIRSFNCIHASSSLFEQGMNILIQIDNDTYEYTLDSICNTSGASGGFFNDKGNKGSFNGNNPGRS
ncbi:MAG: carbohydrate-binding domain-containing protein [Erysipelotrichaceae bacterium]|nr:carbohydrate-binding domain-containing protein [Erysipelotrichaceae bacterium]